MKRRTFVIAGKLFKTKKAVIERVQCMLRHYSDHVDLADGDLRFMAARKGVAA